MNNINLLFENVGAFVSLDGDISETRRYAEAIHDGALWAGPVAYEVIRVVSGVPMYIEDHCARINASIAKLGITAGAGIEARFSVGSLLSPVKALLAANGADDCNVKLWAASGARGAMRVFININKSIYPPPEQYVTGVPAGLFAYTRERPDVKRVVTGFKERVQALMEQQGVSELLLYDDMRRLTEGSRSNLFVSLGGRLFTAPEHMILKGTIRRFVFIAARGAGIEIVETPVTLEEAGLVPESAEAAGDGAGANAAGVRRAGVGMFITGTPIGVLPISNVGSVKLNSADDPVIRRIMEEYEKIARNYIQARL